MKLYIILVRRLRCGITEKVQSQSLLRLAMVDREKTDMCNARTCSIRSLCKKYTSLEAETCVLYWRALFCYLINIPCGRVIFMPLVAAWMSMGASGWEEGCSSWSSGGPRSYVQVLEKPIVPAPFAVFSAYLPNYCRNWVVTRGETSTP